MRGTQPYRRLERLLNCAFTLGLSHIEAVAEGAE